MNRTHKPRGYLWSCATPFQHTPEIRKIQYRDCIASASNVLVHDEYGNLPLDERAAKRRRIEQLADEFLSGKPLEIQSARLPLWLKLKRPFRSTEYAGYRSEASDSADCELWQDELDDQEVLRAACGPASYGDRAAPISQVAQLDDQQVQPQSSIFEGHGEVHAQAACRSARNPRHLQARPAVRDSGSDWSDHDQGSISGVEEPVFNTPSGPDSPPGQSETLNDNPRSSLRASENWFHMRKGDQTNIAQTVPNAENPSDGHAPTGSNAVLLMDEHSARVAADLTSERVQSKKNIHRQSQTNAKVAEQVEPDPPTPWPDHPESEDNVLVSLSPFVYRPRSAGNRDVQHNERHQLPDGRSPPKDHQASLTKTPPSAEKPSPAAVRIRSTPLEDKRMHGSMLERSQTLHLPSSLDTSTRQAMGCSNTDAPVPPDTPTFPQSGTRPDRQSSTNSLNSDAAKKDPSKRREQRPDETPEAEADTQEMLRQAQARLFTTQRKPSAGQKFTSESLTGSSAEKSYRHSQRRALQQLTQESLPGTQTLLDGWNGWATVKKSRSLLGQEVKVPDTPTLRGQEAHASEYDVVRQSPPPQPGVGHGAMNAESMAFSASAPAAVSLSEEGSPPSDLPFLPRLTREKSDQGSDLQGLFHAAAELADDVFGSSTAPQEAGPPNRRQ